LIHPATDDPQLSESPSASLTPAVLPAGEERTEPISTLVFKYVLNPTVNKQARDSLERMAADTQAVDLRRARANRRWLAEGSGEQEDTPTERGRPRRYAPWPGFDLLGRS